MIETNVPGHGLLNIDTIILDLNGTLAVGGKVVPGVSEKLEKLKRKGLRLVLFSGDTRGNAKKIADDLGIDYIQAGTVEEKGEKAKKLGPETCAAIGNGLIDLMKIGAVNLGLVTLQAEGVHLKTLLAADIVVPSINDVLDLFVDEKRLIATLRS
jgi:soluble P-type ATPase